MSHAISKSQHIVWKAFVVLLGALVFVLPISPQRKLFVALWLVWFVCGLVLLCLHKNVRFDMPTCGLFIFSLCVILPNVSNPDFWGFGHTWWGQFLLLCCGTFFLLRQFVLSDKVLAWALLFPTMTSSLLMLIEGLWKFYFKNPSKFTFIDSSGALVSRFYFYDNPNLAAIFATLSFGLLLAFCKSNQKHMQIIAICGASLVFISIFYLASRMAIAIAFMQFGIFCYWNYQKVWNKKMLFGVICALLAIIILFFIANIEIFMLKILYGNEARPTLWIEGLKAYQNSGQYLFGLGSGGFMNIDFTSLLGERRMWHAHNTFLQLLIDHGIAGLLGYILFLSSVLCNAPKEKSPYTQAFWLVVFAHLCFSLVEHTFAQRNALWLVFLFGILGTHRQKVYHA